MEGFRKVAQKLECVEVVVPTIAASSTEGGAEVFKLAVLKMPMSGRGDQLLDYEGISKAGIIKKIREILAIAR